MRQLSPDPQTDRATVSGLPHISPVPRIYSANERSTHVAHRFFGWNMQTGRYRGATAIITLILRLSDLLSIVKDCDPTALRHCMPLRFARDYRTSTTHSTTERLSLRIASASASVAKGLISARSSPGKRSASRKYKTTSSWLVLWIVIWGTSIWRLGCSNRSQRG